MIYTLYASLNFWNISLIYRDRVMVFNATFNNSYIVAKETGVPGINH